ncbi:hypothetical protein BGZ57DRAFT_922156 [Hyaloscypha finlandica]|nr:hypothetical protein BGZ57DRAFT_922156 [Hyaloscypha finlandica]
MGGPFFPVDDPSALGLPPLHPPNYRYLGVDPSAHELTPIYSNIAFQILSYALGNITGVAFATSVNDGLFSPLKLTESSWTVPTSNSSGIIPDGSSWAFDVGDEAPWDIQLNQQYYHYRSKHPQLHTHKDSHYSPLDETPRLLCRPSQPSVPLGKLSASQPPSTAVSWTRVPNSVVCLDILLDLCSYLTGASVSLFSLLEQIQPPTTLQRERKLIYFTLVLYIHQHREEPIFKHNNQPDTTKPDLGVTSWIGNGTDMIDSPIAAPDIRLYPTGLKNVLENGDVGMGFRALFPVQGLDAVKGTSELASAAWVMVDDLYWELLVTTSS